MDNRKELLERKNVIGYSNTLKPRIKNGKEVDGTTVFRVYVSKKEPRECLSKKDLVPETFRGIETDVVEIGEIKALSNPKEKYRPVVAGVSMMHKKGTACTAGLLFQDNETGKLLLAQNNHCAALEDKAQVGDEILQPSPYDGGKLDADVAGHLFKTVPLVYEKYQCPFRELVYKFIRPFQKEKYNVGNKVDIAFMEPCVLCTQEVLDKGTIMGKYVPNIDDKAWKVGRTTGYTDNGVVKDLDWNGYVGYTRGKLFFTDCILIMGNKFSQGGDSSSFVQVGDKTIGSLFAGSDTSSIICKIENIEQTGEVTLV